MAANPWDKLTNTFASDQDGEDIPADAADNILIAWPSLFECLQQCGISTGAALDFGCGGGRLVDELRRQGYVALGVDPSAQMIEAAKRHYGSEHFIAGDAQEAGLRGPFEIVTSIMALQFVENIDDTLKHLTNAISPAGVLVFAVHNPDYVADGMDRGKYPSCIDTPSGLRTTLRFGQTVEVPMFIRSEDDYDRILLANGFQRVFHDKPPFTEEFIAKYGANQNPHPEYLVLGYLRP